MHPNSPELLSFVEIDKDSHFPIQNLPYGIFKKKSKPSYIGVGVAISDWVLDLSLLEKEGFLYLEKKVFQGNSLNDFMTLGRSQWQQARTQISKLLRYDNPQLKDNESLRTRSLIRQSEVEMLLPVEIGDYTDFYSSKEHASNVGAMFRDKQNPLLPNWSHIPVGYHGRASSVVVSGTNIIRPQGQVQPDPKKPPIFAASRKLDFELETAFFVGKNNSLGQPVKLEHASDYIFGMVLMNDWSARDIQKWEYVPLGPFVSKSFATSVSPWVVSMEALEPFKTFGPSQNPKPLSYLATTEGAKSHYDIHLNVSLSPKDQEHPEIIAQTNSKWLYWNMNQQLTHHTITGCNLKVGDLLASGTISGQQPNSYGSLLELTWNGTKPLCLDNSKQERCFLEDDDRVTMSGWCQGNGYRIGFGEVTGKVFAS